jgi:predicted TPR repeat methyltransferase
LHHKAGRLEDAEQFYRRALALEPTHLHGLRLLARLFTETRRFDQALPLLEKALRVAPEDAETHYRLGLVLEGLGRDTDALAAYRRARAFKPDHPGVLSAGGALLSRGGQADEAIEWLALAAQYAPGSASSHNNLGNALLAARRHAEACDCFSRALSLTPDFAAAHNNAGIALQQLGRSEEALAHFRQALVLQPGFAAAHANLASLQLGLGKAQEARQHFEQALASVPDDVALRDNYCASLVACGDREAAIGCYRQVLERDPQHVRARYFLNASSGDATPERMPAELVATLFDGYASTFDQHLVEKLQYEVPAAMLRLYQAHGAPRLEAALDLGCGTGLCGIQFRPYIERLEGIDLSPGMVARAEERAIYDRLEVVGLEAALSARQAAYDLLLAADVFIYIGDLRPAFDSARTALKAGGMLLFSVEAGERAGYQLRPSGRFAHHPDYIRTLASEHGYAIKAERSLTLRLDGNEPVAGMLFLLVNSA